MNIPLSFFGNVNSHLSVVRCISIFKNCYEIYKALESLMFFVDL